MTPMRTPKTFRSHLPTAVDARAVRTRKELRQAMLGLLETRRFEEITIGDVAAAAGVGYSTVCRHYPTLAALLDEIAAEEIGHIVSRTFPTFDATDTRAASLALFKYVHEHRAVWYTLLTSGAERALRREFLRISMGFALAWNEPKAWLPPDLGVTMTISGTIELMSWWLKQADPLPVEDVASIFQRLLVAPLLPDDKPAARSGRARHSGSRSRKGRKRG